MSDQKRKLDPEKLAEEIRRLRSENETLKMENRTLRSENETLKMENDKLRNDMDLLIEKTNTLKLDPEKEIRRLRSKNETLKMENDNLKEQLENFKERMGKVMDLQLGSVGQLSEDLNNPCRESQLKENCQNLIRQNLTKFLCKQNKTRSDKAEEKESGSSDSIKQAKNLIKEAFDKAVNDMRSHKEKMKELFHLNLENSCNTQTKQHFDLAIQQIQMAIHYQKQMPQDMIDKVQKSQDSPLQLAEVYKIGCLMALHNPPILLNWDNQELYPDFKTESTATGQTQSTSTAEDPAATGQTQNKSTAEESAAAGQTQSASTAQESAAAGQTQSNSTAQESAAAGQTQSNSTAQDSTDAEKTKSTPKAENPIITSTSSAQEDQ